MAQNTSTLVHRVRLRPDLKPVSVYGSDAEPLPMDWLSIVRYSDGKDLKDTYMLVMSDDTGAVFDWYQYETLQIAFDQAHSIFGVAEDGWETVRREETFPITSWLRETHGDHRSD